MPRYFTLAQAEALLPTLRAHLENLLRLKTDLVAAEQDLQDFRRRIVQNGGSFVNFHRITALQDRRQSSATQFKQEIEAIHARGCVVKDLDRGLLDFPTLLDGHEVYLCWMLGEDRIRFWHGTQEGFASRKSIDADFLARHRGDTHS